MKSIVIVALLFSSCFASSIFSNLNSQSKAKRDVGASAMTCNSISTQCVDAGASCSNGCPNCLSDFYTCEFAAQNSSAICACANTLVNCYAAAKDGSCDSVNAQASCMANLPNCTCGTPYTGALTEKECNSNSYCSDSGKCIAVKGVGMACNYSDECGDINANPLYSYQYTCVNNKCQQAYKNLPGDPCQSNSDCEFYSAYSLGCVSGVCSSQKVGQACPTADSIGTVCGPNLYCDESDTCRTTISIGSMCDGNATDSVRQTMCGMLGACDSASSTCVKYLSKTQGQSCSFDGECADGLYCSMNTSTCNPYLSAISCTSDAECMKANPDYQGCYCDGGSSPVCIPPAFNTGCNDVQLSYAQCLNDNNCVSSDDTIPGGCVETHCKSTYECYVSCQLKFFNSQNSPICLSNYSNSCDAPSFANKNAVAWAVVASASAAAILL